MASRDEFAPGMNPVVENPSELTPAWITEVLRASGVDVAVAQVHVEQVGTGQIGASYRLHLDYERTVQGVPATLVVKLAAGDAALRARVAGGYLREVAFYTDLADTVAIRRPHLWHGAVTPDGTSFTLVLEDLRSARPGIQADGCSIEEARDAIRNVAGLHAPRWNDPTLLDHQFLSRVDATTAAFMGDVLVAATDDFLERYDGELAEQDKATFREAAAANAAWQMTRPTPFALVHGDYRLDNLMFPLEGRGVCALDWQTVTIAPPARDVAYFLGNSLLPELRHSEEERLVGEYYAELIALGVADYEADDCWSDYRLGQLQGPMITVLGCMYATAGRSERADRMFLAMATRSAAAIRDLDPFALI